MARRPAALPCARLMSDEDPHKLIGTKLEGKYAIESYVARGGFGVVYRATHTRLRRAVAVKALRIDLNASHDEAISSERSSRRRRATSRSSTTRPSCA